MRHVRTLTRNKGLPATAGLSTNDITELENLMAVVTMILNFIGGAAKAFQQEV